MYEIENIPFTRKSNHATLVANFPFANLQVGQSFFVPNGDGARAVSIPVNAANSLLAPARFKVREETHPETGVEGRRVFRVADAGSAEAATEDNAE